MARTEAVSFFFPLSVSKYTGSQEDMLFGTDGDGDFSGNAFRGGGDADDTDDEDGKR